jgi:ankyrin repeat protein
MLTTSEIIDFYNKGTYNIIIDNLKIDVSSYQSSSTAIITYAISSANIDLIIQLLDTRYPYLVVKLLINSPILNELLEYIETQLKIYDIIITYYDYIFCEKLSLLSFNILITYYTPNELIEIIFKDAIKQNNVEIIDALYENNFDIKSAFDKIFSFIILQDGRIYYKKVHIKFDMFVYLEKYGVDTLLYLNDISIEFYDANDIAGLTYCLENGTDVNYILDQIKTFRNIDTIKCLLNYGADLNKINIVELGLDIPCFDGNLSIIKYMVDNGLDLSTNLFQLILHAISQDCLLTVEYFISLGTDIHYDDDYLLYYCCATGKPKIVQILIDNGANIHCDKGRLLQFPGIISNTIHSYPSKHFEIANILIKAGVGVVSPILTLYLYIHVLPHCPMDEKLFVYLLDSCPDLNSEFHPELVISPTTGKPRGMSGDKMPIDLIFKYILEAVIWFGPIELVKLCIKYGADPHINNYSPLKIAIMKNKIDIVKYLLDLGSRIDANFEYAVEPEIIDLLDELCILHNLKKN